MQGTRLDVPLAEVLGLSPDGRHAFIEKLLTALAREMQAGTMSLKRRVPLKREMRDLRTLLKTPVDAFLRLDERTWKRNVLMNGAPGKTHTYWSRHEMWKMETPFGSLRDDVVSQKPTLVRQLDKLLDASDQSKATFRGGGKVNAESVLLTVYRYLEQQYNVRGAFPPFHARFLADRYLPAEGDSIVVDPCAGWGGRLLGTLCVPRGGHVRYVGVDPNTNNRLAYRALTARVVAWLAREIGAPRSGDVFFQPFEKWVHSRTAARLRGQVSLVLTSPPYFRQERYQPGSRQQSSERYREYEKWREKFLKPLIHGAYDLLKPGGVFCLNIADVPGAPLEKDTRAIARSAAFVSREFFRLAMARSVGTRTGKPRHSAQVDGEVYKYEPVFCFSKPS